MSHSRENTHTHIRFAKPLATTMLAGWKETCFMDSKQFRTTGITKIMYIPREQQMCCFFFINHELASKQYAFTIVLAIGMFWSLIQVKLHTTENARFFFFHFSRSRIHGVIPSKALCAGIVFVFYLFMFGFVGFGFHSGRILST